MMHLCASSRPRKSRKTPAYALRFLPIVLALGGNPGFTPAFAQSPPPPNIGPPHPVNPVPANANNPGTEGAREAVVELEQIKVTAQKREESAQEVPTAITVLSGDDLLERGIGRSANEILNQVPNASAATHQHGRPRWWIRGVGTGQQQHDLANPVGFYLDEVYISNASATGFPLFDLDRVEVLRGPQGTLWGKNTTGGAISILSRQPQFGVEGHDGYTKLDYGSYHDLILEGAASAEIAPDTLAARISFHSENQNQGRFKNGFTGKRSGELRDDALRLQLRAKPSENFEALLNLHRREYRTDGESSTVASYAANGVYRNGYIPSTNRDAVSTNAPAESDVIQNGAVLNAKWQLGRLSLVSITGYESWQSEGIGDGDSTPLEISRSHSDAESRQWTQEFRLSSPEEDRLSWVTGLHWFHEKIDSDSAAARLGDGLVPALVGGPAGSTYSDTRYDHEAKSAALFGSARVKWTDDFATIFGVRWTKETKEVDLVRRNTSNGGSVSFSNTARWWDAHDASFATAGLAADYNFHVRSRKSWKALTWDITPEYRFSDHLRGFFKVAHGVKSGGFNTSATDIDAFQEIKPETLDSYELGIKSEWFSRRLIFNATLFHYNYNDVQVNVVGPKPGATSGLTVSYLQNVEKARVDGLELEAEALPTPYLHLRGSLGLQKTRFDKFDIAGGGGNRDGNEFVRSPHVTLQLGADYRIPLANGGSALLSGDYRYLSKQFYYVEPQSVSQRGGPVDYLEQKPYGLLNLRAAYTTPDGGQTWTFYVNNATDKEYKNHSNPAYSAPGVQGDKISAGARRTFGVSFIARF
ncbi:MAG: TonB-dependent receptor [Zoogloeaceae bacterium]|jgi:iron complex outermembrane receptor protein|nr:TonB-dependent receptor [Zoogloeaceae bacterium]